MHGFIPNTEFFPANRVKGPDYNVTKAKTLLAQAGFANGNGFPPMVIYVSGNKDAANHLLAKGVAQQLKDGAVYLAPDNKESGLAARLARR